MAEPSEPIGILRGKIVFTGSRPFGQSATHRTFECNGVSHQSGGRIGVYRPLFPANNAPHTRLVFLELLVMMINALSFHYLQTPAVLPLPPSFQVPTPRRIPDPRTFQLIQRFV